MAQISKPPITGKVYRHFAVATVAITLILAVFADGENRQAVAGQIAKRQYQAEVQREQIAKFGEGTLIPREARRASEWGYQGYGDSFDNDYGKPADGSASGPARSTRTGRVSPNAAMPSSYAPYGIPKAEWDAMSEEQRAAFLRKRTPAQPVVSAEQQRREVDGLMAASAARSGGAAEAED